MASLSSEVSSKMKDNAISAISEIPFKAVSSFFSEGLRYVNEFDKSLNKIALATGQSQVQVQGLVKEYNNLAKELMVTTKDISDASLVFYKEGKSRNEVLSSVKVAAQYARISNLDYTESAENLAAITENMRIPLERASDVLLTLSKNSSSSANDIGEAIEKIGSSAAEVGVGFEQAGSWVSLLTAHTTLSSEEIGASVQAIMNRMKSLRDLGMDSADGSSVNDLSTALSALHISLKDGQGEFRNFGTIMNDLGSQWTTLTDRQKEYISAAVAGKSEQEQFKILMDRNGESVDLYLQSLAAAGTTQTQFNIVQQSTESSIKALQSSMEGLWSNIFDSSAVRSTINLLADLTSVVSAVAGKLGGVATLAGAASLAMIAFSTSIRTGTVVRLSAELATLGLRYKALEWYADMYTGPSKIAKALTLASQAVMGIGISLAISAVVAGLSHLYQKHKEHQQQLEELRQRNEKLARTWISQQESIEQLLLTYEQLKLSTNNGKDFFDDTQEQQYKSTIEQIAGLMPNLVSYVDEKGETHLKNADAIKEEIEYTQKLAALQQKKDLNGSITDIQTILGNKTDLEDKRNNYKKDYTKYDMTNTGNGQTQGSYMSDRYGVQTNNTSGYMQTQYMTLSAEEIKAYKYEVEENIINTDREIAAQTDMLKQKLASLTEAYLQTVNKIKIGDSTKSAIGQIIDDLDFSKLDNADKLTNAYQRLAETVKLMDDDDRTDQEERRLSALIKILGLTDQEVKTLRDSFETLGEEVNKSLQQAAEASPLERLAPVVNSATNEMMLLNKAQQELDNTGRLSLSTIQEMNGKYYDFIKVTGLSNDKIQEYLKTKKQEKNEFVKAEIEKTEAALEGAKTRLTALQKETDATQRASRINSVVEKVRAGTLSTDMGEKMIAGFNRSGNKDEANLKGTINDLEVELAIWKGLSSDLNNSSSASGGATGSAAASKTPKAGNSPEDPNTKIRKQLDAVKLKYEDQIAIENRLIEDSKRRQQEQDPASKEWRQENNVQINAQSRVQKLKNDELYALEQTIKLQKYTSDDYNEVMKQLGADKLDLQVDKNAKYTANINSQLEQYRNLLADKDGDLDRSKSRLGQLEEGTAEYNAELRHQMELLEQKKQITAEAIAFTEQIMQSDKLDARSKADLKDTLKDLNSEQIEYNNSLYELRQQQVDTVLDNYKRLLNEQKTLTLDSIEAEKESESKRHNDRVKHLEEELRQYESNIQKQLDALSDLEASEDYNTELNKKLKDRQELQSKADVLSLDDSREGAAQRKTLQAAIQEKTEEIERFKLERQRSLRKENLQNELKDKQNTINEERELETELNTTTLDSLDERRKKTEQTYSDMLENEQFFYQKKQELLSSDKATVETALSELNMTYTTFFENLKKQVNETSLRYANLQYSFSGDQSLLANYSELAGTGTIESTGNGVLTKEAKMKAWSEYLSNKQKAESIRASMAKQSKDSEQYKTDEKLFNDLASKNAKYRNPPYSFPDGSYKELQNYNIFSAETGGMTPAFSGAKWGILHEKELVLNKTDTLNLLSIVDMTRSFVHSIKQNAIQRLLPQAQAVPAAAGSVYMNVNIEKINGDEAGARQFFNIVQNNLKKLGK